MVDREDTTKEDTTRGDTTLVLPSKNTALLRAAMEDTAAIPRSLDTAAILPSNSTARLLLNRAATATTNSLRRSMEGSMEDTDRLREDMDPLRADTMAASSINIPVRIIRLQASIPTAILSTLRALRTRELVRRRRLPLSSLATARHLAIHSNTQTVRESGKHC